MCPFDQCVYIWNTNSVNIKYSVDGEWPEVPIYSDLLLMERKQQLAIWCWCWFWFVWKNKNEWKFAGKNVSVEILHYIFNTTNCVQAEAIIKHDRYRKIGKSIRGATHSVLFFCAEQTKTIDQHFSLLLMLCIYFEYRICLTS